MDQFGFLGYIYIWICTQIFVSLMWPKYTSVSLLALNQNQILNQMLLIAAKSILCCTRAIRSFAQLTGEKPTAIQSKPRISFRFCWDLWRQSLERLHLHCCATFFLRAAIVDCCKSQGTYRPHKSCPDMTLQEVPSGLAYVLPLALFLTPFKHLFSP